MTSTAPVAVALRALIHSIEFTPLGVGPLVHLGNARRELAAHDEIQAQPDSNAVYQVWQSTDSCGEFYSWDDVDRGEYDAAAPDKRRVLYTSPEAAAASAGKHKEELWVTGTSNGYETAIKLGGHVIARTYAPDTPGFSRRTYNESGTLAEAYARRIVVCVNYCAGTSTDALEARCKQAAAVGQV